VPNDPICSGPKGLLLTGLRSDALRQLARPLSEICEALVLVNPGQQCRQIGKKLGLLRDWGGVHR
jgi:hypothetical protein